MKNNYLVYSYYGAPTRLASDLIGNYLYQKHNFINLSEFFFRERVNRFKTIHSGNEIEGNKLLKSSSQWTDGSFKFQYGFQNGQIVRVKDYNPSILEETSESIKSENLYKLNLLKDQITSNKYFLNHFSFSNDITFDFLNENYTFIVVKSDNPFEDFLNFSISCLRGHFSMPLKIKYLKNNLNSLVLPQYLFNHFLVSYNEFNEKISKINNKIIVTTNHTSNEDSADQIFQQLPFNDWKAYKQPHSINSDLVLHTDRINYFINKEEIQNWFKTFNT